MDLQINSLDGPTLAAIISIFSVSVAGTGLFFTAKSFRENTKSQYIRILKEFHSEITSLESSQERNYDYDLFAVKYLNLHDTIAYLAIKKIIPKDIARFFDPTFGIALALLQMEPYKERYEISMKSLTCWCRKQGIKQRTPPQSYPLTNKTTNIVTLIDLEQVKEHLASGWKYVTSYPATKENIPHYINKGK